MIISKYRQRDFVVEGSIKEAVHGNEARMPFVVSHSEPVLVAFLITF